MEQEIFKDIPGWEGYYQASNLGRIKALERLFINVNGYRRPKKERIVKDQRQNGDYRYVHLRTQGRHRNAGSVSV